MTTPARTSGATAVLIVRMASIVIAFGTVTIVTRILSTDEVAAYFLHVSIVLFLAPAARLGVNFTILQIAGGLFAVNERRAAAAASWQGIAVALGGAILFASILVAANAAGWIARIFNAPLLPSIILGTAIVGGAETFRGQIADTLRADGHIAWTAIFELLLHRLLLFAFVAAMFARHTPTTIRGVVAADAGAGVFSALLALAVVTPKLRPFTMRGGIAWTVLAGKSLRFWIYSVAAPLSSYVDLWLIGAMGTPAQTAIYGPPKRLAQLLSLPLIILNGALPPVVARLHATHSRERLQLALRSVATVAFVPTIAGAIVFAVFGDHVLGLMFGPLYAGGRWILAVLSVGAIVNVWTGSCGIALSMTGGEQQVMVATLLGGAAGIVSGIVFGWLWGPLGFAASAAALFAAQNLLQLHYLRRKQHVTSTVDPGTLVRPVRLAEALRFVRNEL